MKGGPMARNYGAPFEKHKPGHGPVKTHEQSYNDKIKHEMAVESFILNKGKKSPLSEGNQAKADEHAAEAQRLMAERADAERKVRLSKPRNN